MQEFTVPPPAEPGDQVAVVAPASNVPGEFSHVYDLGVERIDSMGVEVVEYPTATREPEWLLEHPEARAEDVMDAFRDPDVSAVIANIGGNDQIRVLEHLDPDVLREHPTRFFGWSDNTNLALYLWNQGVVSYYGGATLLEYAMDGEMFDYTREHLARALFDERMGTWEPADCFTDQAGDWTDPRSLEYVRDVEPSDGWQWHGGGEGGDEESGRDADGDAETVTGRVWGGCWEILDQWFMHGGHLPDPERLDGAVLAMETSEEIPHPELLRGHLRALGERGFIQRFDAVLVGRPVARSHEAHNDPEWRAEYRERHRTAIVEEFERYNPDAPVVTDMEFGHTYPTFPLPIGAEVEVDPGSETVRFP